MKQITGLIFFAVIAYLVWPYIHLYQLNNAVVKNDMATFEKLIDFESVNKIYQENLKWRSEHLLDSQDGKGLLPESMRERAQSIAGAIGNFAADKLEMDANGILGILRTNEKTPWTQTTFAFFESPTRFTVRLGELGRNPIHLQMTLQDWNWRVTAVYD